jgi:hypothetical protein
VPVPTFRPAPAVAGALRAGAAGGVVAVDDPVGTAVLVAGTVEAGDVARGCGDRVGLAVAVGVARPVGVAAGVVVCAGPVCVLVGIGVPVGVGDAAGPVSVWLVPVPVWEFPVVAVARSGGRTMIHKANMPRKRTVRTIVETRGRPAPDKRLLRLFIRSSPPSGGWRRPRPRP